MADRRTIRYPDWRVFDPRHLDVLIEVDAAGIDFGAVYTWEAEHAGTLYQFIGCRPMPGPEGKALFDLGAASLLLTGPVGWTSNPLWPQDRDDQPPPA
jgi:hypothetical protein